MAVSAGLAPPTVPVGDLVGVYTCNATAPACAYTRAVHCCARAARAYYPPKGQAGFICERHDGAHRCGCGHEWMAGC